MEAFALKNLKSVSCIQQQRRTKHEYTNKIISVTKSLRSNLLTIDPLST